MAEKKPININKFLEEGTTEASLQDLQQKGFSKVKVLDEKGIQDLISRAIDRIVDTETSEERSRIQEASRKELDRLMVEHRQMKSSAELNEAEKSELIAQIQKLQKENSLIQDLQQQTIKKAVGNTTGQIQKSLDENRKKVQTLQEQLAEAKGELDVMRSEYERNEAEAEEFRSMGAEMRGEIAAGQKRMESLQKNNLELKTRLEEARGFEKENRKLRSQIEELEDAESYDDASEELKEEVKELKEENLKMKGRLEAARSEVEKLRKEGPADSPEWDRLRTTVSRLQEEVASEKEKANAAAEKERKSLEWKIQDADRKVEMEKKNSRQAREDYDRINAQMIRRMSEVEKYKKENEKLKEDLEKAKEAETAALASAEALGDDKGKYKYSILRLASTEEGIPTKSHGAWELVTMVFEQDGTRALLYRSRK